MSSNLVLYLIPHQGALLDAFYISDKWLYVTASNIMCP